MNTMETPAGQNTQIASITPEMLVEGTVGLVSLPEISIKINEMVDDPKCSAARIGKVIGKDAALTARLLKIVNSAFYRFPARIETVSDDNIRLDMNHPLAGKNLDFDVRITDLRPATEDEVSHGHVHTGDHDGDAAS